MSVLAKEKVRYVVDALARSMCWLYGVLDAATHITAHQLDRVVDIERMRELESSIAHRNPIHAAAHHALGRDICILVPEVDCNYKTHR